MKGKLPERRTKKEKKRILSLLLSLLLITALLLTPAGAQGFNTELELGGFYSAISVTVVID